MAKVNIASNAWAHERIVLRASPAKEMRKWLASAEGASEENLGFGGLKCSKTPKKAPKSKNAPFRAGERLHPLATFSGGEKLHTLGTFSGG